MVSTYLGYRGRVFLKHWNKAGNLVFIELFFWWGEKPI